MREHWPKRQVSPAASCNSVLFAITDKYCNCDYAKIWIYDNNCSDKQPTEMYCLEPALLHAWVRLPLMMEAELPHAYAIGARREKCRRDIRHPECLECRLLEPWAEEGKAVCASHCVRWTLQTFLCDTQQVPFLLIFKFSNRKRWGATKIASSLYRANVEAGLLQPSGHCWRYR